MGNIPSNHPLSVGKYVHGNVDVPDITTRVQEIRSSLSDSRIEDCHLRDVESDLKAAERFAKEGNREMMEFCIRQANKHMDETNADAAMKENVHVKIETIRSSVRSHSEHNYHVRRVESELKEAERYAKKGNRAMMEQCIIKADDHMVEVKATAAKEKEMKIEAIRSLLNPDTERKCLLRQMEIYLMWSKDCAKKGDRDMMEYWIRRANEYSEKAEKIRPSE